MLFLDLEPVCSRKQDWISDGDVHCFLVTVCRDEDCVLELELHNECPVGLGYHTPGETEHSTVAVFAWHYLDVQDWVHFFVDRDCPIGDHGQIGHYLDVLRESNLHQSILVDLVDKEAWGFGLHIALANKLCLDLRFCLHVASEGG